MQFRSLLIASAPLLAAISSAQDVPKKIDYTTKATTLTKAFAELSKQSGVSLFVEEQMADEIIILRLKDVPIEEAMQKIADTVGAQWSKKPNGYELERTMEIEQNLRQQAAEVRIDAVKRGIEKRVKETGADKTPNREQLEALAKQVAKYNTDTNPSDNWRERVRVQNSEPSQVAVIRFLSRIDPKVLASMEDGERFVFSNKPTKMQMEVQGDFTDLGQRLKDEHNIFVEAMEKLKDEKSEQPLFMPNKAIASLPNRFVLAVTKQMLGGSMALNFIAFDADNKPVLAADTFLNLDDGMQDMIAQRARLSREIANEKEIPVSPITKQMLTFIRSMTGNTGAPQQPVTGELRQAMIHPEQADPLSYAASDAFIGIAEARNENLVLYPDDSMFLVAMFAGMEGSFKPSLILQAVSGMGQVLPIKVQEENGWLTMYPVDRIGALKTRMDRVALGEYLRDQDTNGYVTIASTAKLAAAVKGYQLPVLAIFVPMMLSPEASFPMNNDLTMLKIYSTLHEGQMQRLESSEGLRAAELSSDQHELLQHFVFVNDSRSMIAPEPYSEGNYAASKARAEITETLADGLPADAVLGMTSSTEKVYFCQIRSNNSTYTSPMSVDSMAWYVAQKDHPELAPRRGWEAEILSVKPGETRTLVFNVKVADGKGVTTQMTESRKSQGGPWTLDKLPDDLKAALAKAVQRYSQMNAGRTEEQPAPPPQSAPPRYRLRQRD